MAPVITGNWRPSNCDLLIDLESIIRKRRLWWFGHVYQMNSNRFASHVMDWTLSVRLQQE